MTTLQIPPFGLQKTCQRFSGRFFHACRFSDVEQEIDHVAIFHDILFALASQQPLCLCVGQRAARLEIVKGNYLCADKAALKIRMDLTGCLRGLRPLLDSPGAALVAAGCQEGNQPQQFIAALDEPVQTGRIMRLPVASSSSRWAHQPAIRAVANSGVYISSGISSML